MIDDATLPEEVRIDGLTPNLQRAREHYHTGRHAEAEAVCGELLRETPNQPEAIRLLASIAFASGNLVEAEGLMRHANYP